MSSIGFEVGDGVGVGLGEGVGVGVDVGDGEGVGVGVGDGSSSGVVVNAVPTSMRSCIGPSMRCDVRSIWSAILRFRRVGKTARNKAASPATNGAAIDVPLHVAKPPGTVLKMPSPGAVT